MTVTGLKALIGKLNSPCLRALEGAAGLCMSRTNFSVEIEHWLLKLLEPTDGDLPRVFKHYDIDPGRVTRELTRALDQFKTGNSRPAELSPSLVNLMIEAWTVSSLEYGAQTIRSGYLLAVLLTDRHLAARVKSACPKLSNIPVGQFARDVNALVAGTTEDAAEAGPAASPGEPGRPAADFKTPLLHQSPR